MDNMIFAQGMCYYKLFCVFVIGALIGDWAETTFCYRKYKKWLCRSSFVYGYMSAVWGFAFVLATLLYYVTDEKGVVFVCLLGTVFGGIYEYFCSMFTESLMGVRFWDYSSMPYNIHGRINLKYCLYWGVANVIWVRILFPVLEAGIEKIPVRQGEIVCRILTFLIFADAVWTLLIIKRYMDRMSGCCPQNKVEEYIDCKYPDPWVKKRFPHMEVYYQKENMTFSKPG